MNERLPITTATITQNHARSGPNDVSRQRRTVVSAPTNVAVSLPRR